ncbi:MAG: cytochrome d ubiquinol oxidase subunit II [Desulfobacterales bacterium]
MELFDYLTLKLIWWLFVVVLLVGFALLDGFDLGVGTLLPFVARSDTQRRVLFNAIGPTWEGNQVWFITAGGALFAAWPLVYAAAFSGFYWALLLVLFALFFRPVAFDYRSKISDPRWRTAWDWGMFVGGAVPALVFGVAFGNLLQGVPFEYDDLLRSRYTGTFFQLLNPYALLVGVVSLTMLAMHGAVYLQMRTEGEIQQRAQKAGLILGIVFMAAFALAGVWQAYGLEGYRVVTMADPNGVVTVWDKAVETVSGGWLHNFTDQPGLIAAPGLAFVGAMLALILCNSGRPGLGFVCSALSVSGVILTATLGLFPFIMPSSTSPNTSLTIYDAVSSHHTLNIMFIAVVVFLPIVLLYTAWVYRVMRGKITEAAIEEQTHSMY